MAEPNAISSTPLTLHLTGINILIKYSNYVEFASIFNESWILFNSVSSASLICSNGWILPSKPDPYVKVVLRDKEMETNVAHKTLHPTWEKLFNLFVVIDLFFFIILIFNQDLGSNFSRRHALQCQSQSGMHIFLLSCEFIRDCRIIWDH